MEFVGADSNLGTETEFVPVIEARTGIHKNCCGIYGTGKMLRRSQISRDYCIAVF